jgi:hypothetical protein
VYLFLVPHLTAVVQRRHVLLQVLENTLGTQAFSARTRALALLWGDPSARASRVLAVAFLLAPPVR